MLNKFTYIISLLTLILISSCSDVVYDNPIDPDGTNPIFKIAGALDDDNNDGMINAFDPDWIDKFYPKDRTPPVITLFGGDTVTIEKNDRQGNLTKFLDVNNKNLIKAVDPEGSPVVISSNGSDVNYLVERTTNPPYKIIYTAHDTSGNSSTKFRYVYVSAFVADTNPPNLQIGDSIVYLELNKSFIDPGATAYDLEEGKYVDCKITGVVDTSKEGTYTLTYTAADSKGNTATAYRIIIVSGPIEIDNDPPVLKLLGADTVSFNKDETIEQFTQRFVDPGYTVTDNRDPNPKVNVSSITFLSQAYYFISYYATDNSGNTSEAIKRIIKTGIPPGDLTVPPIIMLILGDSVIQHIINKPWVEPGFVAMDGSGNNIPEKEVKVDSANLVAHLDSIGLYSVTYTVKDSKGVQGTKVRWVNVINSQNDRTPPVITLIGRNPDTCLAQTKYVDPGYTAFDDRDGNVTANVTKNGEVNIAKFGMYTITYSVRDAANNNGKATRDVWVVPDLENTDLKVRYNVPSVDTLKAISGTFIVENVDGPGPDLAASNITAIKFEWSPPGQYTQAQLQFQITYSSTPYNKDFNSDVIKSALSKPGALMVLSGTTITGLDGSYYVTIQDTKLVWVQKDGKYAIILKKSALKP